MKVVFLFSTSLWVEIAENSVVAGVVLLQNQE